MYIQSNQTHRSLKLSDMQQTSNFETRLGFWNQFGLKYFVDSNINGANMRH